MFKNLTYAAVAILALGGFAQAAHAGLTEDVHFHNSTTDTLNIVFSSSGGTGTSWILTPPASVAPGGDIEFESNGTATNGTANALYASSTYGVNIGLTSTFSGGNCTLNASNVGSTNASGTGHITAGPTQSGNCNYSMSGSLTPNP